MWIPYSICDLSNKFKLAYLGGYEIKSRFMTDFFIFKVSIKVKINQFERNHGFQQILILKILITNHVVLPILSLRKFVIFKFNISIHLEWLLTLFDPQHSGKTSNFSHSSILMLTVILANLRD